MAFPEFRARRLRDHPTFREMVADTVRVGMEGGGFILSPTSTPFSWPEITERASDNMIAMLDVGLDVGRY